MWRARGGSGRRSQVPWMGSRRNDRSIRARPGTASCAQRLAASQRRRLIEAINDLVLSDECSTPRGITATTTPRHANGLRQREVLNASRHHSDDDTQSAPAMVITRGLCSTPRGITATTTMARASAPPPSDSAQRLAASQRRRPTSARGLTPDGMCSTPRSITATTTRPGPRPCHRPSSAQRLAASQRRRRASPAAASPTPSRGAQRLAASQRRRPTGSRELVDAGA